MSTVLSVDVRGGAATLNDLVLDADAVISM